MTLSVVALVILFLLTALPVALALTAGLSVLAIGGYIRRAIAPHTQFEQAFGPGWQAKLFPALVSRMLPARWSPRRYPDRPVRLGAWHFSDKGVGTDPFFRHLASHGHAVLHVAYRLAPEADIRGMVHDVKRAVAFIKRNARQHGVDPDRMVVGSASAGGHIALLAERPTPTSPPSR